MEIILSVFIYVVLYFIIGGTVGTLWIRADSDIEEQLAPLVVFWPFMGPLLGIFTIQSFLDRKNWNIRKENENLKATVKQLEYKIGKQHANV